METLFTIQTAIQKIVQKENLSQEEMRSVMHDIMSGKATHAQLGGFLVGMRIKGETAEELAAAATVLRELVVTVPLFGPHLVDIVGTGGDEAHTFNISTASAFVVAAAGGQVAKHGNRSVSSRSGSADVLEKAGVKLTQTPEKIAECVKNIGVGFMFAPQHHTAMKHALGPRKELGIRTLFNLIGPLTNPANVPNQLLGVFAQKWVKPLAEVLKYLGSHHVLVVHSEDGLDEISIGAPTFVAELKNNQVITYNITPEQFGFVRSSINGLRVKTVDESLSILQRVLQNESGSARDIVALNAGAAIYVSGLTNNLETGIIKAKEVIASGAAYKKFQELIEWSQKYD